jgi:gamma-glutamylcyclotransferase (GGCT)/AIG2-like uncharacterized protein YtfP
MKYFAYGSNCNPAVMRKKQVGFTSAQHAVLPGYRLLFNKKALRDSLPDDVGFANLAEAPESNVEGVLYEIVDHHLPRLDQSERYPEHYTRIEVTVHTRAGSVACTCYQAQPDKVATGLKPSRNYLNHILAARDFLSWQYYEALDRSQTYEGRCACCMTTREVIFIREGSRLHMLCQACREARLVWGDARGRSLTVAETEAVMTRLVQGGAGFPSIRALLDAAIARRIIDP